MCDKLNIKKKHLVNTEDVRVEEYNTHSALWRDAFEEFGSNKGVLKFEYRHLDPGCHSRGSEEEQNQTPIYYVTVLKNT